MDWLRSVLLPVQGSHYARSVDDLFLFIMFVSAFFFLLVVGLLLFFILRYRRRGPHEVTPHIAENFKLEVVWTVFPLVVVMVIFFWGFRGYMDATVAPADSLELHVTARQWLWQFEYPNGTRTINEIHLPVGKPVKLIMTSDDVIHSFFVPSFRLKADVLPNRYTELWFTPTREGMHVLLCAEYCGRGHSDMSGKIWVESEDQYQDWLEKGDQTAQSMPLAQLGRMLYESRGCATCHSLDGTRGQGPSFKGIFGEQQRTTSGPPVLVDENYVRESILQPQAKIVEGYQPIMPTFQGVLKEREIQALIEFIKSQK
jgi:cytochrome c oxidase subunit 2